MSGAIRAYDSRLHQSNQGLRVQQSTEQRRRGAEMVWTTLSYTFLCSSVSLLAQR